MPDITAIGEILIDLTQVGKNDQGIPLFAANPGGAPANVAVAAARLGAFAAFIGKVGNDGFGDNLAAVLKENHVQARLARSHLPTTLAVVHVAPTGERSFRFLRGADRDLAPGDVPEDLLAESTILHFGSVSFTARSSRTASLAAVRKARQAGALVSYDPNYRAALWASESQAVRWMRYPLSLVDILKLSEEELPLLAGTDKLDLGTARLAERGPKLVLVTLGSQGVFYRWQDRWGRIPAEGGPAVDSNGAGDSFLGALLSRLVQRPDGPLAHLEARELEQILIFANRAAGFTCSRSGAIPAMPTWTTCYNPAGRKIRILRKDKKGPQRMLRAFFILFPVAAGRWPPPGPRPPPVPPGRGGPDCGPS